MDPSLGVTCNDILSCYQQWGWIMAAAAVLLTALRGLQSARMQTLMASFPPLIPWDAWPLWVRFGVSTVLGLGITTLAGVAAGRSPWAALIAGIPAVLLSAGADRKLDAMRRIVAPTRETASLQTKTPTVVR